MTCGKITLFRDVIVLLSVFTRMRVFTCFVLTCYGRRETSSIVKRYLTACFCDMQKSAAADENLE